MERFTPGSKDRSILAQYRSLNPWGLSTAIDLYKCNPQTIRDSSRMSVFLEELCYGLNMKRFSEPFIVRFGDNPRVTGLSIVQLIETSSITGHFAEERDSAHIDIFSCKEYPPHAAAYFCRRFFQAGDMHISTVFRQ